MNLIVVLLFSVLGVIGSFFVGHHIGDSEGYARRDIETIAQIAKLNAENQTKTDTLVQQINDKDAELQKEKENAKKEIAKRDADIATGKLRLYVRTKSPTNSQCENASSTSGSNSSRAEIDPAFAQSIVRITDDGDSAIRKLNACIAVYNQVKEMINGSPSIK